MGESIVRQTIPTENDLALRDGESSDRLLKRSMDDLKTPGQRLDHIDEVESQASSSYTKHLTDRARKLMDSVTEDEKIGLDSLIQGTVTSFKQLRERIEALEKKYAPTAEAENSPQQDQANPDIVATSENEGRKLPQKLEDIKNILLKDKETDSKNIKIFLEQLNGNITSFYDGLLAHIDTFGDMVKISGLKSAVAILQGHGFADNKRGSVNTSRSNSRLDIRYDLVNYQDAKLVGDSEFSEMLVKIGILKDGESKQDFFDKLTLNPKNNNTDYGDDASYGHTSTYEYDMNTVYGHRIMTNIPNVDATVVWGDRRREITLNINLDDLVSTS